MNIAMHHIFRSCVAQPVVDPQVPAPIDPKPDKPSDPFPDQPIDPVPAPVRDPPVPDRDPNGSSDAYLKALFITQH
jgi:hypothetical protein